MMFVGRKGVFFYISFIGIPDLKLETHMITADSYVVCLDTGPEFHRGSETGSESHGKHGE